MTYFRWFGYLVWRMPWKFFLNNFKKCFRKMSRLANSIYFYCVLCTIFYLLPTVLIFFLINSLFYFDYKSRAAFQTILWINSWMFQFKVSMNNYKEITKVLEQKKLYLNFKIKYIVPIGAAFGISKGGSHCFQEIF